jgi:hypothetical protein
MYKTRNQFSLSVAKGSPFVTDLSVPCLRTQRWGMYSNMPHGMGRLVVCSSPRHVSSPTLTLRRMHACEDHETVGEREQSLWL